MNVDGGGGLRRLEGIGRRKFEASRPRKGGITYVGGHPITGSPDTVRTWHACLYF